ncbi:uncharacterized protein LOC126899065 isoform X2 [Daktulosphaira vitifoliae]|uniref:uncharacterized protein LOC126899065 isoform X2 n=1 Tax=Daktulosphaira vitifoliae TaxID=58002 RepID=UPI0021A9C7BC|nr:uncharacterized protein LOC126899065 isoform X2 [Daktulosphaira vitifoliae]
MNHVKYMNKVLCFLMTLNAVNLSISVTIEHIENSHVSTSNDTLKIKLPGEEIDSSKNVEDQERHDLSTVTAQADNTKTSLVPVQIKNSILPRQPTIEATELNIRQHQHNKQKKKKPQKMTKGKHKKKQTYKDKLLPLLLIPVVIQIMTLPMMIMNLKMMAMKAMLVGKLAMILVVVNFLRNLSLRAVGGDVLRGKNPQLS